MCVCAHWKVKLNSGGPPRVTPHPGFWGMITQYAFRLNMLLEILKKSAKINPVQQLVKKIKPKDPAYKWKPHVNCSEPNEEIQIEFGRPITSEKVKSNISSLLF